MKKALLGLLLGLIMLGLAACGGRNSAGGDCGGGVCHIGELNRDSYSEVVRSARSASGEHISGPRAR